MKKPSAWALAAALSCALSMPIASAQSISGSSLPIVGANTAFGSIPGGTPGPLTQAQITALINPATASLSGAMPAWGGLVSGTCVNGLGLNSSNLPILVACPGVATSIQSGVTGVTSGTPGQVLIDNGGTLGTAAAVLSVKKQVFTASGTYTPSTGMLFAMIECVGSGGGGGGSAGASSVTAVGGGGGSGSYSRALVTAASVGVNQTVTINNAGTGGVGNNAGTSGGSVSVGSLCVANGGSGGNGSPVDTGAIGGAGGTAGTGDIAVVGNSGGSTTATSTTAAAASGYGAGSHFGGGVAGILLPGSGCTTGNAGSNYGAGGSGGGCNNTATGSTGGAGSKGVIYITEYNSQ